MNGLSRKEAAALAGVSEPTIIGWQIAGYLRRALPGKKHRLTAEDVLVAKQLAHGGDAIPRWRADPAYAGKRLQAFRESAGLSQLALAARTGLRHEVICRLERGKRSPQGHTLRTLSAVLGIEPVRFVDDSSIGLETLSVVEAALRLGVPEGRAREWVFQGVLPGRKVSGRWRIPAVAVDELNRSGRLRGASRRLDG